MAKKLLSRKKINPLNFVFTGSQFVDNINYQLITYKQDSYEEISDFSVEDFKGFSDSANQHWLNINGIHNVQQITNICNKLGIHNLVIQDILDVNQRPKFQDYDNYCFFSIKSILLSKNNEIESEQLSFILGKNYLISFQEKKALSFEHVRQRIREKLGVLRNSGSDYLLYLLIESILDDYFTTIDNIEKQIKDFGVIELNSDPSPKILKEIELFKRQVNLIERTINPIKDFLIKIEREQFNLIHSNQLKYFLELKDLCLTLLDNCNKIELRLESSINLFFSVQGHRMNQIMKILTIVATIFIPLTFIVGIYGMNFKYMPELALKWGYLGVWLIIVVTIIGMLVYFKKKKWF